MMNGTSSKMTGRFAVTAAAGMLMGGLALTPAQAADLGGDCCADLEERVAELEATAARKGNPKVSLKIFGEINYVMLYWNDGGEDDVYIGQNNADETKFRFTGTARFKPGWSAGFLFEFQTFSAASLTFDQKSDGAPTENADGIIELRKAAWHIKSDRLGEIWMGRYSPATEEIKKLNVADTPHVDATLETGAGFFLRAPAGTGGCAGSGCLYDIRLGALAPGGDTRRGQVIRYNTPSLAGLVLSVSWGEDDIFDVAAYYTKQWNSIRVLGGIGYHRDTDEDEDDVMLTCAGFDPRFPNNFNATQTFQVQGSNNTAIRNTSIDNPGVPTGVGNPQFQQASSLWPGCRDHRFDLERLAGSFSAMHTPSGLYAYFGGNRDQWSDFSVLDPAGSVAASNVAGLRTGGGETEPDAATHWYLQLGIQRRMGPLRNLGATTLYGEYQEWDDWHVGTPGIDSSGRLTGESPFGPNHNQTTPGIAGNYTNLLNQQMQVLGLPSYVSPVNGTASPPANGTTITDTSVTGWGFGTVQSIDKAALQLWLSYRQFDPEVRTQTVYNAGIECASLVGGNAAANGGGGGVCNPHPRQLATQVVHTDHRIEQIWMVNVGGKLKF